MSLSTTSPMVSTMPKRYSGWPCRTQSTARPPAVQYSETILHHEMSALNNSRAIELSTFRTDFSLVIVTETWGGKILCCSVQLMIFRVESKSGNHLLCDATVKFWMHSFQLESDGVELRKDLANDEAAG